MIFTKISKDTADKIQQAIDLKQSLRNFISGEFLFIYHFIDKVTIEGFHCFTSFINRSRRQKYTLYDIILY